MQQVYQFTVIDPAGEHQVELRTERYGDIGSYEQRNLLAETIRRSCNFVNILNASGRNLHSVCKVVMRIVNEPEVEDLPEETTDVDVSKFAVTESEDN